MSSVVVTIGLAVAAAVWLIISVIAFRRNDATSLPLTLTASLLAAVVWSLAIIMTTPAGADEAASMPPVEAAITPSAQARGTCASITAGMAAAEVRAALGPADEVIPQDDVRGPGAELWIYRSSRCRIHVVDAAVVFVD